jgi:hypothetical protein
VEETGVPDCWSHRLPDWGWQMPLFFVWKKADGMRLQSQLTRDEAEPWTTYFKPIFIIFIC